MKQTVKAIVPSGFWRIFRKAKHSLLRLIRWCLEKLGLVVTRKRDYYAPTPSEFELAANRLRWIRPSSLHGVDYDLDKMEASLAQLCTNYLQEFLRLVPYEEMVKSGFGPGYPYVDAFMLYGMLRATQPKQYLEVGSGLSTAYACVALAHDPEGGKGCSITCIEPFPFEHLRSLPNIRLIKSLVQDVPVEEFKKLGSGDVLFIDSSHILRLDGDVPFLFLEVLPQLAPGVIIHIHDIPFPFNIPYPAEYWTLVEHEQSPHWPMYWNEAMLVQALLAGNATFEIIQSLPLLRFHRESRLRSLVPFSKGIDAEPNTFSSLWLRKR